MLACADAHDSDQAAASAVVLFHAFEDAEPVDALARGALSR